MPAFPLATVHRWALWLAAWALLAAGGCGYGQDVPRLPAGAESVALQPVRNLTDQAELDVRLRGKLLQRLQRHAHVRIVPEETSTLLLTVQLDGFSISRVLDPALSVDRSFVYTLRGRITLVDQRSGRALISNQSVIARAGILYAGGVLETPAIRDEGIDDVLDGFAEQVEHRLFLSF